MQYAPECMVDTETTGVDPGCKVLSIGATMFEPVTGVEISAFYATISMESCAAVGLVDDPDTMTNFWGNQSVEARMEAFSGRYELIPTLTAFSDWFKPFAPHRAWCHGLSFDYPVLKAAYRACNLEPPWKFWTEMCSRTVCNDRRFDYKAVPREGVYHHALDDARHQVKFLTMAQRGEQP